jgi:outer membrane biosynthesis protein TonB
MCALILLLAPSCGSNGRTPAGAEGRAPASTVDAASDSALGAPRPMRDFRALGGEPARVTLVRVAPARAALEPPLPAAEAPPPEALEAREAPAAAGALAGDDELRAPITRTRAAIDRARARRGWVDLDVRVDENGDVSDAMFADGEADSATIVAAIDAALAMRFYPAVRGGRPVAVWCRQRFDLRR